jgi:nucleotide-binding universal stress UspA family protein
MKKIKYQKILVTHDGSDCASAILPHVESLAKELNAEVLLLRIVDASITNFKTVGVFGIRPVTSSVLYEVDTQDIAKKIKKAATEEITAIKNELINSGIKKVAAKVIEGYAPEVILYMAQRENIDLIMMSTHGRTGLKRVLIGSVAEYVIHMSSCPVYTVHPDKNINKYIGREKREAKK